MWRSFNDANENHVSPIQPLQKCPFPPSHVPVARQSATLTARRSSYRLIQRGERKENLLSEVGPDMRSWHLGHNSQEQEFPCLEVSAHRPQAAAHMATDTDKTSKRGPECRGLDGDGGHFLDEWRRCEALGTRCVCVCVCVCVWGGINELLSWFI